MAGSQNALAKAGDALAAGKDIGAGTARNALEEAFGKIKSMRGSVAKARDAAEAGATAIVHVAELQGTVFLGSMAEGYFGEDKTMLGSVDARAVVGGAVIGWGVYDAMKGKGGGHQLALGNGLAALGIASYGRKAGRMLAEKRAEKATAAAAPAAPAVQGPLRELAMSGDEAELAGLRRGSRSNRFVPVEVR